MIDWLQAVVAELNRAADVELQEDQLIQPDLEINPVGNQGYSGEWMQDGKSSDGQGFWSNAGFWFEASGKGSWGRCKVYTSLTYFWSEKILIVLFLILTLHISNSCSTVISILCRGPYNHMLAF